MLSTAFLLPAFALFLRATALYHAKLVYEYPEQGTWLENLAVRSNGSILLTSLAPPGNLHMINPLDTNPTPVLIHQFPNYDGILGITEGAPDVFYVATLNGNLSALEANPGSNHIFRVTFESGSDARPAVEKVAQLKKAKLLNGILALNPTTILAADSESGVVWAVDVTTGKYRVAVNDTLIKPPSYFPFTVNGLKFRGSDKSNLYFTSTANGVLGRVPINSNGIATGPAVALAYSNTTGGAYDDFTFDKYGNAYAATGGGNSIQKIIITPAGTVNDTFIVAGNINKTTLAEPTAAQFGRTNKDKNILYVTTGGGTREPVYVNGTATRVGAQLVAVTVPDLGN